MIARTGPLNQRGEVLAARMTAPGRAWRRRGAGLPVVAIIEPLAEASCALGRRRQHAPGRALPRLYQWPASSPPSPRRADAQQLSRYRDDDLQRTFGRSWPICAGPCRRYRTDRDRDPAAGPRNTGVRVGPITDRLILRAAMFVLTVQADVPYGNCAGCSRRRSRSAQSSIFAILSRVAAAGSRCGRCQLRQSIPFYAGATLFELDLTARIGSRCRFRRVRDSCVRRFPEFASRIVGNSGVTFGPRGRHDRQPVFEPKMANGRSIRPDAGRAAEPRRQHRLFASRTAPPVGPSPQAEVVDDLAMGVNPLVAAAGRSCSCSRACATRLTRPTRRIARTHGARDRALRGTDARLGLPISYPARALRPLRGASTTPC